MFIKVTTSGPRRYVQIVESYRDEAGRVKKRTVATLGRADQISGELDSVIDGLLKVTGRKPLSAAGTDSPAIFESARALGNVWALTELWKELGFLELRRVFGRIRHTTDVEALIRIMVLNRLCDPDSKLGVLRWLETVALPDMNVPGVTHQQLLSTMDALMDHQDAVDAAVSGLLRPMVDQDLSVVFYDMTTIRAEGLTTQPDVKRGRKLSDSGAKARFYHEVCEARLGKIFRVNMPEELFSFDVDEAALQLAQMMDGKLLLVTNVPDMNPEQVIARYKSLADIERGFKVLKSELEIGPVYHRLPERIRAHAFICFMALVLHRVMRRRLRAANTGITPERALQMLQHIQHHRVTLGGAAPLGGVSSMSHEHNDMFKALKVKQPTVNRQLSLL